MLIDSKKLGSLSIHYLGSINIVIFCKIFKLIIPVFFFFIQNSIYICSITNYVKNITQ